MALFLVGGGFFGVHALEILPAEDLTMMALMRLTGIGIILSDIWFRREQELSFFSLEASNSSPCQPRTILMWEGGDPASPRPNMKNCCPSGDTS